MFFPLNVYNILILTIAVVFYFLPSPIDPNAFSFPKSPPSLVGSLAVNTKLQEVDRRFDNKIFGPESFDVDKKGNIYTGTADGKILRIKENSKTLITRTGINDPNCGSFELEPDCGRPNGIRLDQENNLIVADAYKGLLKVKLPNGEKEVLAEPEIGADGVPFRFLNGLAISKIGLIYFTDSSSKWNRRHNRYEVLEMNALGRLMLYDPKTKKIEVLLNNLYFANGIALSADESYLLITETSICRIHRYHLTGPNKGLDDIFHDNLPGYPDNIRLTPRNTFYVGLSATRYQEQSWLGPYLDLTGPYPSIRKLIAKVIPLWMYDVFLNKDSMFIEINENGEIINSFQDPSGATVDIAGEAFEHDRKIYIGSYNSKYMSVLYMKDLEKYNK